MLLGRIRDAFRVFLILSVAQVAIALRLASLPGVDSSDTKNGHSVSSVRGRVLDRAETQYVTVANQDMPCVELFAEGFQSDPETTALRRFQKLGCDLPGLDVDLINSTFLSRSIVFIGDSTLYYPAKWMKVLLEHRLYENLSQTDLSRGNIIVNPTGDPHLGMLGDPPLIHFNRTRVQWLGYAGRNENECYRANIWERFHNIDSPEVVVANMGMHWLHFIGMGRDVSTCIVQQWIAYEEWLRELVEHCQRMGVKVLLLKTTNKICDEKYTGTYGRASVLFNEEDPSTIEACKNRVRSMNSSFPDSDITNYCVNGVMTEKGASFLNQRLHRFVENFRMRDLKVAVWNDHDLDLCEYTNREDGRHYHPLTLALIRSMANNLQQLLTY